MDTMAVKTRARRIAYMLREKGFRYMTNYLWVGGIYNNDFIRDMLLTKLYPWFVFYPRFFEIEITTRCDLRCTMCEHTYWNEKPRDMSFEQFRGIIDQFPKLKWLGTTGIGSSFLNKDYIKMLEYAKERGIYIELFDPCHRLDGDTAERVVRDSLIDRLFISMDAATKETYEKIRVGANFDTVTANIRNIVKTKRRYSTSFPEISFHYIISRDNYAEAPRFVELVHEMTGTDNIGIMFTHLLHGFDEIKDSVFTLPEEVREEAIATARRYKIRDIWGKNARAKKQTIDKCTEWTMPFIFADGSVIPCCAGNEANKRDFQVKHRLGNAYEEPFEKIWNGRRFKGLRDMIHKGQVPVQCRDCPGYELSAEGRQSLDMGVKPGRDPLLKRPPSSLGRGDS
jgi:MoaA/NifB/PqqE/SkfB family radical SAM enzyme